MEANPVIFPLRENLRALARNSDDNPQAVIIFMQAKEKEEPVALQITTTVGIISHFWELPQLKGGDWLMISENLSPNAYCIMIDRSFLDQPLIIGLELDNPGDPISSILKIETWDGAGGTPNMVYIE